MAEYKILVIDEHGNDVEGYYADKAEAWNRVMELNRQGITATVVEVKAR